MANSYGPLNPLERSICLLILEVQFFIPVVTFAEIPLAGCPLLSLRGSFTVIALDKFRVNPIIFLNRVL